MNKIVYALLFVVLLFGLFMFSSWLLMICWNFALVGLFPAIPEISIWQSLAIIVICRLIFGGSK